MTSQHEAEELIEPSVTCSEMAQAISQGGRQRW